MILNVRHIISFLLVFSFFFSSFVPVIRAQSSMEASVITRDLAKPAVVLINNGSEPCQIIQSGLGTISISKVIQDGKEIAPVPIEVGIGEGLEQVLQSKLRTLRPDERVEIPLEVFPYKDGHAFQSITWSKQTGAFGLIYPFNATKPYTVEVTYSAPISVTEGAPLCDVVSGTNAEVSTLPEISSLSDWRVLAGIIAGVIVLLIIGVVVLFNRTKKPTRKMTVIVFFLLSAAFVSIRPAYADYSVPEDDVATFNGCMDEFARYPDITGPVLDALDGRNIVIFTNDRQDNYSTSWPDGSYHIHWDSTSEYNYHSEDGGVIPSTPCDRLFHEMYHIYEMTNGSFSRDDCAGSGIETKEVNATRAQNRLREAMGLPPRTHYGTDRLPAGDCSEPPPSRPACTGPSCGTSTGDPHLRTFDHLSYDFMAVGEFILSRSTNREFEVQTRQTPWVNSRQVSINTAVAMKIGTDIIELRTENDQLILLVNKSQQELKSLELEGGGTVTVDRGNKVLVEWPDSSKVHTTLIARGLHIVVDPAQSQAGKLEGLLGNFNNDSADDLIVRGETKPIEPEFNNLYPKFADSWRITNETSLFTYKTGQSTASFTDRSFPEEEVSAKTVRNREAAESICRSLGVTEPETLDDCILDVALTGRAEFALAAHAAQQVQQVKTVDYGGKKYTVTIESPGEEAVVEFEATAGEKIYVDLTETTLPDQCGNFRLLGPDKDTITSGCIINGRGSIDGTVLQESGTYTIALRSTESATGKAVLQLISITDQKGTVMPDGQPVVANITKPGVVAEFTFEGTAGQHMFIDIPSSSLPDQCGGIGFKGPTGTMTTGCVINGKGFVDRMELPATGTYTVFIDASDTNTGKATLKLITAEDDTKQMVVGGQPATVQVRKPGSIATLTFSGIAGQRVFIEIPASTLPDQCGGIGLFGPDEKSIDSACIINGSGDFNAKGIVLPQTGTYSIIIDASENHTGEVTVQVKE